MEDNNLDENSNKIEIVSGNGKDLDISKVYDHLNIDDSNTGTPEKNKIVIPKEKK